MRARGDFRQMLIHTFGLADPVETVEYFRDIEPQISTGPDWLMAQSARGRLQYTPGTKAAAAHPRSARDADRTTYRYFDVAANSAHGYMYWSPSEEKRYGPAIPPAHAQGAALNRLINAPPWNLRRKASARCLAATVLLHHDDERVHHHDAWPCRDRRYEGARLVMFLWFDMLTTGSHHDKDWCAKGGGNVMVLCITMTYRRIGLLFGLAIVLVGAGPEDRRLTNPRSIVSPRNAHAAPVNIADLYNTKRIGEAAWSPDGRQIAYISSASGRLNLWIMNADGSGARQIVLSNERQMQPVWTKDGRFIIFAQDHGGDEMFDLFRVSSAGGASQNMTNTAHVSEDTPLVSPDGNSNYLRNARAPLLVLQGENDIRVPKEEAAQVVQILRSAGKTVDVTYYPQEGHGFMKREDQIDALTRIVNWFDRYLKGRR